MSNPLDTLRARCALAGICLHVSHDDQGQPLYLATRWNLSRTFASLEEVEHWLHRVTGERA